MLDPKTPVAVAKRSYRERLNELLAQWGALVLWVYFGIFAIVLVGFAFAIQLGFTSAAESTAKNVGTWGAFLGTLGAAWVATKLTQPLRIAATLVLTPALAALLRRARKQPASMADAASVAPESTSAEAASLEPTEPSKP